MKLKGISARLTKSFDDVESKRNVAFIHVPKCGGTSIDSGLRENYLTLNLMRDSRCQRIDSLRSAYVGAAFDGLDFIGGDPRNNRNMLFNRDLALYQMLDDRVKYVSGHFPFDRRLYEETSGRFSYMTVLRDPVEKWLSNYFYRLRREKKFNGRPLEHWKINASIEEYLESDRGRFHGYDYVKYFGGVRDDYDYTSSEAIETAKENLRYFSVIGVLEDGHRLQSDIKREFDLAMRIEHRNKSRSATEKEITDDIREKIRGICSADLEIYNYAKASLT